MKNIFIITTKCLKSARTLAAGLNNRSNGELRANVHNPDKDYFRFHADDYIFRYGCSIDVGLIGGQKIINKAAAIKRCVSKYDTFDTLLAANLPTVSYTRHHDRVPKEWELIVARKSATGRKAEDLEYISHDDLPRFKEYELFTEFFEHKYEYRIVVFNGAVVGRYYKREIDGEWNFMVQPKKGFETMDEACIKAAEALKIDYVGFDVVAKTKKDFRILEANSGPILTEEAEDAIISYYLNLE